MYGSKHRPALTVMIEPGNGGFIATMPSVPWISGAGETEEEALREVKAALEGVSGGFGREANPESLAKEQGVSAADFESLLGDFWPEDEDPEDFTEALARWREEPTSGTS
jgi:predicted RNase H-like HicB family nuclease